VKEYPQVKHKQKLHSLLGIDYFFRE